MKLNPLDEPSMPRQWYDKPKPDGYTGSWAEWEWECYRLRGREPSIAAPPPPPAPKEARKSAPVAPMVATAEMIEGWHRGWGKP